MCSLFATTYPEKTRSLIMIGTYAKRMWAHDYPWAPSSEARERFFDEIRTSWGGPVGIQTGAEPGGGSRVQAMVEHLPASGRQPRRRPDVDADERRD